MCSIVITLDKSIESEDFLAAAAKVKYRGPDDTRYVELTDAKLLFHRLAIMGLEDSGMQPFHYKSKYLLCNGEIYGFRKYKQALESTYSFVSGSDCEIILPLYEKYQEMMFNMLDSEFALVIYDEETNEVIAARDPIGIRPLFFGFNTSLKEIGFASEAKALKDLYTNVLPFPPGHYYKNGEFIAYNNIAIPKLYHFDSLDVITKNIHDLLFDGVKKRLDSDSEIGFLLSGGLDSSLICGISAKLLPKKLETFAIGMRSDAIDLKYAREVADYIGSNHHEVIIDEKMVIAALDEVIYTLETFDITTIRASIGMYLLCRWINQNTPIKVIMTGEISDELFGYKYTDFAPDALAFQREAEKRIAEIYMYDVLRADRCISANHMESRVPFGDLAFVDYVMSIEPSLKMNTYGKGKYLLRKAFLADKLIPDSILNREKAAFSDAVGHSMVDYLKEFAEEKYSDSEYKELSKQYSPYPFTKEALLYRKIFEKYYPNRGSLIKDYWMPNQSWEGCNVNDPSARVLANYGDSGK